MKKINRLGLGLTVLLALVFLSACGCSANKNSESANGTNSSTETSTKADAFTGATKGTDDFATLQKGFTKNGAWLNAVTKDIDASGETLKVDGEFKGDKSIARELALYTDAGGFKPSKTYTLTVKKIIVNSPNFCIGQGTGKGDVYVNTEGFHFEGTGKIDGNLIFKNNKLMNAFKKIPTNPNGDVSIQSNQGVVTGKIMVAKK
jgi:hypothetical protein